MIVRQRKMTNRENKQKKWKQKILHKGNVYAFVPNKNKQNTQSNNVLRDKTFKKKERETASCAWQC